MISNGIHSRARMIENLNEWFRRTGRTDGAVIVHSEGGQQGSLVLVAAAMVAQHTGIHHAHVGQSDVAADGGGDEHASIVAVALESDGVHGAAVQSRRAHQTLQRR